MKLRMEGEGGNYFEVTKSDHYGFTLTEYKPTKEGSKNPYTTSSLFYANLEQVAQKLVWLGLEGGDVEEIVMNLTISTDRLTATLEKFA